jgi:hypothetical protein
MTTINSPSGENRNVIGFASGGTLVLGLWLAISPWVLGYLTPAALWNSVIVGIAIALLASARLAMPTRVAAVPSWINVALGAWLIVSPFLLNYTLAGVTWNSVIVGALVAIMAFASGSMATPRGAGPRRAP